MNKLNKLIKILLKKNIIINMIMKINQIMRVQQVKRIQYVMRNNISQMNYQIVKIKTQQHYNKLIIKQNLL